MPYTLNFSDPTKITAVIVPDMPPGINAVDTSLSLVGRGYPNYGKKIAENFLHLLENFASPFEPEAPIEGQLWYDTRSSDKKILKIHDGANWASANGIFQQSVNPKTQNVSLNVGDIWVDTGNGVLNIFMSNDWLPIGPLTTSGNKTGLETSDIEDNDYPSNVHTIVKIWAEGTIIAIITDRSFVPKVSIEGFSTLLAGINIRNRSVVVGESTPIFNGTALSAQKLQISGQLYSAGSFLRTDDLGHTFARDGQVITGQVFFQTPSDTITDAIAGRARDGIVINNASSINDSNYIQFYKSKNNAVILNNDPSGSISLRIYNSNTTTSVINAALSGISLNTNTSVIGSLSVTQNQQVAGSLYVASTATINSTLTVNTTTLIHGDITIDGRVTLGGELVPTVSGGTNLGSSSKLFNTIYANSIGSPTSTGTAIYGNITGSAASLRDSTVFKLQGQVTATSFNFNGTNVEATFATSLTPTAISGQTTATTASTSLTFLTLDTYDNQLKKLSYPILADSIYTPGMIIPFGSNNLSKIPDGWLLCNGNGHNILDYQDLYNVIGTSYGGTLSTFNVPNYVATAAGSHSIYHIIKT